jgi:hypothetical protein
MRELANLDLIIRLIILSSHISTPYVVEKEVTPTCSTPYASCNFHDSTPYVSNDYSRINEHSSHLYIAPHATVAYPLPTTSASYVAKIVAK